MLKIIEKIPSNISLNLVCRYNQFNYLFIFGWLGFIKFRSKKVVSISINSLKLRVIGKKALFYTYLKLIRNFYSWTNIINKQLILLKGVGYKYRLLAGNLYLVLGYSHIIKLTFCKGIKANLISNKLLELSSISLYLLNAYIYKIKKYKKLDVYKGKGILLEGEKVIKKEGKKATF
jgi:large subunit ribosomal protein L6